MKNTVFLAIMSIITVTNLHSHQAKDNFKNCNPRLSSKEIIELGKKDNSIIYYLVVDCQENPIKEGCGKLMASLLHSSNDYWLWPSPAQKKAAQIVAEYREKLDSISSNIWQIPSSK